VIAVGKRKQVFAITGAVLVFAVALLIFDSILLKKSRQASEQEGSRESTAVDISSEADDEDAFGPVDAAGEPVQEDERLLYIEWVNVGHNTPEYGLELSICARIDRSRFIKIKYYKDGASTEERLTEEDIPELSEDLFRISQALLNPVYSQLYLLVKDNSSVTEARSTLYRIDLNSMSVSSLSSYIAGFGEILFNKDFTFMAYSFKNKPPANGFQENKLLEVYDVKAGEYTIRASRDKDNNLLGKSEGQGALYNYELIGWEGPFVLRLVQSELSGAELDKQNAGAVVLYDIEKNEIEMGDGSSINGDSGKGPSKDGEGAQSGEEQDDGKDTKDVGTKNSASKQTRDSEQASVLKEFYRCLGSPEDYQKGLTLLHPGFKLRLGILRQFGIEEITLRDIESNRDNANVYSELLRGAKFDIIADEAQKGDVYVIRYYHKLSLGAQPDVRQLMAAHLVKHEKGWKIILIEDGI